MRLILYVTDHCDLCEQAFSLLASMPELAGHTVTTIDIALDDALLERFGSRIPLLEGEFGLLDWPFSAQQLGHLLRTGRAD